MDDPNVGIVNKLFLIPPSEGEKKKISIKLWQVLLLMPLLYLSYLVLQFCYQNVALFETEVSPPAELDD